MMANTLRCRWVRRRLALLAGDPEGGDVRWDDRRLVERHLIGCPSCRAERDSLALAMSALRGAATAPIPSSSRRDAPSIWPDLERQIRASRHARPNPLIGFDFGRPLGLAAGLLVAGTAIGLVGARLRTAPAPHLAAPPRVVTPGAAPLAVAPRPALPPDGPALAIEPQKAPRLDPDPKASRDPQRSVGQ